MSRRAASRTGIGGAPPILFVAMMLSLAWGASLTAQERRVASPSDFPIELAPLLAQYHDGHYAEVVSRGTALASATPDARLRREARAVVALGLMRLPERKSREQGRALLGELVLQDASLGERPECLLAMGDAHAGLNETAAALDCLTAAVDGFIAAGRTDRAAAALVLLAQTWSRHSEWEHTPAHLRVPVPAGPAAAAETRVARVRDIRTRLMSLPDTAAAVARVECLLAGLLLENPAYAAEGAALLEALVQRGPVEAGDAAMLLGSRYERDGREAEAAALYDSLARSESALASAARERVTALRRPAIELELPAQIAPGVQLAPAIQTRNTARIRFELRRLDLRAWLEQQRGRLTESQLPESGASLNLQTIESTATRPMAWWSAAPHPSAPASGAYVAIARGIGADGAETTVKRLVIVSSLRAALFCGRQDFLVWCASDDPASAPVARGEARLWVHGAFVARRVALQNGLARLPVPGEAQVLTERRWTCLAEVGEQLALCQGALPAAHTPAFGSVAVVAVSALRPQVEQGVDVAGWLIDRRGSLPDDAPGRQLTLELRDVEDVAHFRTAITLDACGAFLVHVPISANLRARNLSVALLDGSQVVPTAWRPPNIAVPDRSGSLGAVRFELPAWNAARDGLSADVTVRYPWGYRAAAIDADVAVRAVQSNDLASLARTQATSTLRIVPFDDAGGAELRIPLETLDLFDDYIAMSATVATRARDGLYAQQRAESMLTPRRHDLWISVYPPDPHAGESCAIDVVTRDWETGAPLGLPSATLSSDGAVQPLVLTPVSPHRSIAIWNAAAAGKFELAAECVAPDGVAVAAARVVSVLPAEPPDPRRRVAPRLSVQPGVNGRGYVAQIAGRDERSLLLLTENGEPLAATPVGPLNGLLMCPLAAPLVPGPTQVTLAALGPAGVELLASADLTEDPATPAIRVESAPANVHVREPIALDVVLPAGTATLLARWVSVGGSDFDPHVPPLSPANASGLSAWPRGAVLDASELQPDASAFVPRHVQIALSERESIRFDSATLAGGRGRLSTIAPDAPGLHAIELIARADDGRFMSHRQPIRVLPAVEPLISVPPLLSVGDRFEAAASAASGQAPNWGAGLVEVAAGIASTPSDAPPDGASGLRFASLEASSPGVFTAELASASGRVTCDYEIRADAGTPLACIAATLAPDAAPLEFSASAPVPSGGSLELLVERDLAEAVVDSALHWLDEPTEGTAWNVLCLDWSAALLRLRPGWDARPVAELLADLVPGVLGRQRIAAAGTMSLDEFRTAALARVCATRERDGGWSWWPGGLSNCDATCLAYDAVLAASAPGSAERGGLRLTGSWLRQRAAAAATPAAERALVAASLADDASDADRIELLATLDRCAADPSLTDADRARLVLALNRLGQPERALQLWQSARPTERLGRAWHAAVGLEMPHAAADTRPRLIGLLATRDGSAWETLADSAWLIRIASECVRDDDHAASDGVITCDVAGATVTLRHDARKRTFRLPAREFPSKLRSDTPLALLVRYPAAAAAKSSASPVHVVRDLMLATPSVDADGHVAWRREPYVAGMTVAPRSFISVIDVYELPRDLEHVELRQRMPSLFHTWQGVAQPEDQIGRAFLRDSYWQVNVAERLPAGTHRTEYLMAGVRRGACLLPPPELRVGGRVWPTQVVCTVSRLLVSE